MTSMELLDLLGGIDDRFYDEVLCCDLCDPDKPLKFSVAKQPFSLKRLVLPIAACLALAIGAVVTVNYLNRPVYIGDISVEAQRLYLGEYPELEQYENTELAVRSRVMDINCDGTDEIFVVTATGEAPPQIYSDSGSGVEKTGELELTTYGTRLTDPEQLFLYEEDGEKYWYYSYLCYNDENEAYSQVLVHAAARINYNDGAYFTDFPFGYGTLDVSRTDRRYAENFGFSLSDGKPFDGGDASFEEIPLSELEALWEKHTGLPEIIIDFYEEYPELPFAEEDYPYTDDPYDGTAIPQARVYSLNYNNEYVVWLIAENVHRREDTGLGNFLSTDLKVALVKGGQIVSEESVVLDNDFTSVENGKYIQCYIGRSNGYFRLYELKDTPVIVYIDKYGLESNFFAVKDDKVILLKGITSPERGEIGHNVHASINLMTMDNSLIDTNSDLIYTFDSDAFDKDPNVAPHFTARAYTADDHGGDNVLGLDLDDYVSFDPFSDKAFPHAVINERRCGNYTVKLLGDDVQIIYSGAPHTVYSKLYIVAESDSGNIFGTEIENISEYLNPDKIRDQIFTFEMKDGIGVGVYTSYFRAFARLYSIKDGKVTCLVDPDNYDPQYMVSDIALSGGYHIDASNNAIVLDRGGSIGLNFQTNEISDMTKAPSVKGGKFLVTHTGPSIEIADWVCGTEADWQRFMNVIHSGEIARIDIDIWLTEFESRLPDTAAERILELLSNAQMKLFEEMGNPPVGGGPDRYYAYDENGTLILEVTYNGYGLDVIFPGDTTSYAFDGENCGLDELSSLLVGFAELGPSFY